MRVLIAGCGYVGCALAERLRDAGHEVTGLRRNAAALPDGITPLAVDLGSASALQALLAGERFDGVVFCAAADGRSEAAYRRAYIEGLSHLLDVIAVPERLLFTSSTGVYGQDDGEDVDESSPTEPTRFSGEVMLEAEEIVDFYAARSVAVRFGGIYGPGRDRLVRQVETDEVDLVAGVQLTNRIHRDDCAGVLAHLLTCDDPARTYVGVDDEPVDKAEVVTWLARKLGRSIPKLEAGPVKGKRCLNRLLKGTGYRFRYPSFREGYGALIANGR